MEFSTNMLYNKCIQTQYKIHSDGMQYIETGSEI